MPEREIYARLDFGLHNSEREKRPSFQLEDKLCNRDEFSSIKSYFTSAWVFAGATMLISYVFTLENFLLLIKEIVLKSVRERLKQFEANHWRKLTWIYWKLVYLVFSQSKWCLQIISGWGYHLLTLWIRTTERPKNSLKMNSRSHNIKLLNSLKFENRISLISHN